VSDIDTAAVESLKALDPDRPIREADMCGATMDVGFGPKADIDRSIRSSRQRGCPVSDKVGLPVMPKRQPRGSVRLHALALNEFRHLRHSEKSN
jgi:hypothetical protein